LYIAFVIGIACYTERKKENLENVPGHNCNPRKNLVSMFRCVKQIFLKIILKKWTRAI
jgi:hypothetical protein